MKTTKITRGETESMLIASLPTRPTAPSAFGGKGYTAAEMKAAFDRLPIFIIERFNMLLDEITSGEICESIPTSIESAPTLAALINAVASGTLASVVAYRDTTLTAYLETLREDVDRLISKIENGSDA